MRRSYRLLQVIALGIVVVLIGVLLVWVSTPSKKETSTIYVSVTPLRLDRMVFSVEWGISAKPGTAAYARDFKRMQGSASDFCDWQVEFSSAGGGFVRREKAPGEDTWRVVKRRISARRAGRYLKWIEGIGRKRRFALGTWGSRYWVQAFVSDDVMSMIWAEKESN